MVAKLRWWRRHNKKRNEIKFVENVLFCHFARSETNYFHILIITHWKLINVKYQFIYLFIWKAKYFYQKLRRFEFRKISIRSKNGSKKKRTVIKMVTIIIKHFRLIIANVRKKNCSKSDATISISSNLHKFVPVV